MGRAEFLEPLMGTWPERVAPPVMTSFGSWWCWWVRVLGGVWRVWARR